MQCRATREVFGMAFDELQHNHVVRETDFFFDVDVAAVLFVAAFLMEV